MKRIFLSMAKVMLLIKTVFIAKMRTSERGSANSDNFGRSGVKNRQSSADVLCKWALVIVFILYEYNNKATIRPLYGRIEAIPNVPLCR